MRPATFQCIQDCAARPLARVMAVCVLLLGPVTVQAGQAGAQLLHESQLMLDIGDTARARTLLDSAAEQMDSHQAPADMLTVHLLRASIYQQQNRFRQAWNELRQAWLLNARLNDPRDQYRLYRNLGQAAMRVAHWQEAREALVVAAELAATLGDKAREIDVNLKLAQAEIRLNDLKLAAAAIVHAEKLARAGGRTADAIQAGVIHADILARQGQVRQLQKKLAALVKENRRQKASRASFLNAIELGRLYRMGNRQLGRPANWRKRAFQSWQHALDIARTLNDPSMQSISLGYLGRLYADEARFEDALRLTSEALGIAHTHSDYGLIYRWHLQQARIFRIQGLDRQAEQAYRFATHNLLRIRNDLYGQDKARFERDVASLFIEQIDAVLFNLADEEDGAKFSRLLQVRQLTEMLNILQWENARQESTGLALPVLGGEQLVPAGTAVIYPLALRDRLELLVFFNGEARHLTAEVNRNFLLSTAERFQQVNQVDELKALRHREQLESWLVKPVMDALGDYPVSHLVWVTSGALAGLDWRALYANGRALNKQLSIAVMPSWFGRNQKALKKAVRIYPQGSRQVIIAGEDNQKNNNLHRIQLAVGDR